MAQIVDLVGTDVLKTLYVRINENIQAINDEVESTTERQTQLESDMQTAKQGALDAASAATASKNNADAATTAANTAATNANNAAANADSKAAYAQTQGDYAKAKGDYVQNTVDALNGAIPTGNTLHNTLTSDISTGNTLHNTLQNDITSGNNTHTTLQQDIAQAQQNLFSNEITQARGSEVNLDARLDKFDSSLADKASQSALNTTNANVTSNTNSIATNTANIATHTSQIASLASGSPKGTYATVSALTTAFPSGNTNIYIVTADGGWYYWNGSTWTKGGTYQSTGIDKGAITRKHISTDLSKLTLIGYNTSLNFELGTISTWNGANVDSAARIRTVGSYLVDVGDVICLSDYSVYKQFIHFYDLNDNHLRDQSTDVWITTDYKVTTKMRVRIALAKIGDTALSADDITFLTSDIKILSPIDKYVTSISTNTNEITALKNTVNNLTTETNNINDMYMLEIDDTVEKMFAKYDNNRISYAVLTDSHCSNNETADLMDRQLRAITELAKRTDLDFIAILGDLISDYGSTYATRQEFLNRWSQIARILRESDIPVLFAVGNHDDFHYLYPEQIATHKEWQSRFLKPIVNLKDNAKHDINNIESRYYYYDLAYKKTRVIVLDSIDFGVDSGTWGFSNAQITWLATQALFFTEQGWRIIILSHMGSRSQFVFNQLTVNNSASLEGVIGAFNNSTTYSDGIVNVNFTTNTNKILAYSYGHNHADLLHSDTSLHLVYTSTGASYITYDTSTGLNSSMGYTVLMDRSYGTIKEALFDVFSIDNTTLSKIRFGDGDDSNISLV